MAKNQIFPEHGICAGIQQTKQTFIKDQIQKNLCLNFLVNSKNPIFGLFFTYFPLFVVKKKFQKTKLDIFLVDNEFKNLQWKILNLISTHTLYITTNASTKGWGQHARGDQPWDFRHEKNGKLV